MTESQTNQLINVRLKHVFHSIQLDMMKNIEILRYTAARCYRKEFLKSDHAARYFSIAIRIAVLGCVIYPVQL